MTHQKMCRKNAVRLLELGLGKQLPFETHATTEYTSSTDMAAGAYPPAEGELANYEYGAGSGVISTYMTEDYALGTATCEFHNGIQTDAFHLLYRRVNPVTTQQNIGTIYARYSVNDDCPPEDETLLEDQGRKLGIQHRNLAVQLHKAKPIFGNAVTSLRLTLVIPRRDGQFGQVWLGNQKLEGSSLVSKEPCPVFLQDGPVYMAFHTLLLTDHGREYAVEAKWVNGHLLISFYNYSGPVRNFGMKEMLLTANGFVAQIGRTAEYGSLEAFRAWASDILIRDSWQNTAHSRFTTLRRTEVCCHGTSLSCEYSPVSEGVKHITVNGQPLSQEKLYISGFDCRTLPFL